MIPAERGLNAIEHECLDFARAVRDWLSPDPGTKGPGRDEYIALMTQALWVINHLTDKQFGFSTGQHPSNCKCKGARA